MHGFTKPRRVRATPWAGAARLAAAAVVIGQLIAWTASAIAQPPAPDPAVREPRAAGPAAMVITTRPEQPPNPQATMRAFNILEPWVRAWAVPAEAEAVAARDAKGDSLPPVYGACVNLRLHGRLLGRGQSVSIPGAPEPDALHIVRATAQAIAEADAKLPVANDLDRAAAVKLLTPDVQISLELAGAAAPVNDQTWAAIDGLLAPGLDGLIVRVGERSPEFAFPSTMMMAGLLPQRAMRGAVSKAIGENGATEVLRPLAQIREQYQIGLWRFRVSHAAQTKPGQEPVFLYRGARLIGQSQVDPAGLRQLASRAAATLSDRLGARQPGADAERTTLVSDAIAAFALARFAEHTHHENDRRAAESALAKISAMMETANETRRQDPTVGAAVLLAATASARMPAEAPFEGARLPEQVLAKAAAVAALQSFLPGAGFESTVPMPARPLVVLGFVEAARSPCFADEHAGSPLGPDTVARTAQAALDVEMQSAQLAALVNRMPWLGWAACGLAGEGREVSSAPALRQMRDEIWKHQLTALDAGDDGADMVGGIVFTSGNTSPLPTWQCVRPLAFLATMLGDERLTEPAERDLELARLLQAFRFLRQLQVDESCGWMCPNPEAAIGGIRAATWDQSMPPDATSLALLATCELLKSMDKLAAARAAGGQDDPEPAPPVSPPAPFAPTPAPAPAPQPR